MCKSNDNVISELTDKYHSYIAQAQNIARRKKEPSTEEYQMYMNAAQTAQEISQLNFLKDSSKQQWESRIVFCQKRAIEIDKKLRQTVETFRTKNANEDVPAEMIARWYREKPCHSLDDVAGMDELKEIIREELLDNIGWDEIDDYLKVSKLKFFLFYGPFGTGKTFFMEAVASELMDRGFQFIQIPFSDVCRSYVGVGEKILQAAFQEAADNAPCILLLDELECFLHDRSDTFHNRLVVTFLEYCHIIQSCDKSVIIFATTNYPQHIDMTVLSRVNHVLLKVPLPSEETRKEYFIRRIKKIIHFSDDIDAAYMASATEHYSFRSLDRIVIKIYSNIKKQAFEQFALRDENGCIIQGDESDEKVIDAIKNGTVVITKEIFDEIVRSCPPENQEDVLAAIEAFENKA